MSVLAPLACPPGVDPQAEVDRITRAAGSSFGIGMRLLSRPRARAMRALYAFCRVVDDIADGDPPADQLDQAQKLTLLREWRLEVDRLYDGRPVSAIGKALEGAVTAYDLPRGEFLGMLEGMETDAAGPMIAPHLEDLLTYTRRVAGTVGHLSMRIFGAWRGTVSGDYATALADAVQLTNILRDIEEDADLGRLYLPREILLGAGLPLDPAAIAGHPKLVSACAELGAMARSRYRLAADLAKAHDRFSLVPALAMTGVYRQYLDRMEADGWQRRGRVSLSRWAKISGALGAVLRG